MTLVTSPPFSSMELVLARTWAGAEALFQRYGLSIEEARLLLEDALPRLESLNGVLPGAADRLLKRLESGCRQLRAKTRLDDNAGHAGYERALDQSVEFLRGRRRHSERKRRQCTIVVDQIDSAWRNGGESPTWRPSVEMFVELLSRARRLWGSNPKRSFELTRVAQEALLSRHTGGIRRRLIADLEARSHAYSGNSLRLLRDFRRAEQEFAKAQAALSRGTRDPRERAEVLALLASLRSDQSRFSEALRLLHQATAIYRWAGARHREGELFMLMATIQASAGDPQSAITLGERALELLDPEESPRRVAGAAMNMAHYFWAAGRPEEARKRLQEARRLVIAHGSANDLRGLKWIEGQVAFTLGDLELGERLMLEVRDEYAKGDDGYQSALVTLELAAEYLDQGRSRDALRMAKETVPIFQSLEIHREVLAALIALARAIELETANAGLVRELIQRLQDTRDGGPRRAEKPS